MKTLSGLPTVLIVLAILCFVSAGPAFAEVGSKALLNCRDFAFSTEEEFLSRWSEPPDGNPIISDGDLLGPNCSVCARNTDLLKGFDVQPEHDLGLDAVHVVDVEQYLVAFSTELDSPNRGQFSAGDLLVTNGAIIPNSVLIFKTGVRRPDMGLDGVQLVGKSDDIIEFLDFAVTISRNQWLANPVLLSTALGRYGVDILFSVEGTGPYPNQPAFLDGDLLSAATGVVVTPNSSLLPTTVPAGIPKRGVDFGLDAVNIDPDSLALNLFSTELLFQGKPEFTDGDVLRLGSSVVIPYPELVKCFEPAADFLGLDALFTSQSIIDIQTLLGLIDAGQYIDPPALPESPALATAGLQLESCADLAFSTEEDFLTLGPEPPDGNPIISDGDLLSPDGQICARNIDLVGPLDVDEDLGLDAADIIKIEEPLVAFSTELDSPHNGTTTTHFTAGDLLATNGARVPNTALTYLFKIGYDIGLDGIHFIGAEKNIYYLLEEAKNLGRDHFIDAPDAFIDMLRQYEVDLWFSTEGTAPSPDDPGFLDGDLLSARKGIIVASNRLLLPDTVPAGIPDRGVDFGLDAVSADREGQRKMIVFSTELLFAGKPGFNDGDLLLIDNGVIRYHGDLISAFEPRARFLGIDALSMFVEKPDLVITQIRCDSQNRKIGYEVKNIGFATALPDHHTQLQVPTAEGTLLLHDIIQVPLNPGDVYQGWFDLPENIWPPCGELPVTVCADHNEAMSANNLVDELNEYNNCREGECIYAELEWTWNNTSVEPAYDQVMMAPVAADLNGDAIPDIVFLTFGGSGGSPIWEEAILRAISGNDGAELFSITDPAYRVNGGGSPAVADIDDDRRSEIMATDLDGNVLCFEHDGAFKWRTSSVNVGRSAIAVADLDEDGTPEIIVGKTVFNNDGTLRWSGTGGSSHISAVADLDLSGHPEVIAGGSAYQYDGTLLWSTAPSASTAVAVADLDSDPYPEIVLVGGDQISVKEHDGTLKWGPVSVPNTGNGPPMVADVDGDGQPEIGIGGYLDYTLFEADGTIKWTIPIVDTSSRSASATAFDFNGDGVHEIVYSDHYYLRILRGTDGAILFEAPNPSGTLQEHPIIIDVDNDDRVEIVAPVNNYAIAGNTGIEVYGNDQCWPKARPIWNQHSYHVTNINDDATVPRFEADNWNYFNHFRTQSAAMVCKADFDADGDVDGSDLATFAGGTTGLTITEFAAEFGRTDCP